VSSGQITQGNGASGSSGGSTAADSSAGDDVSGTSVMTRNDSDFWKGIETDIQLLLGSDGKGNVIVNRQSGVIVVRGMPTQLRDVAEYLRRTQSTVTRQVVLEAKIVEVELNSAFQAGINWTTLLTSGNQNFFFGQSSPPGGFGADPLSPPGRQVNVTPGVPVVGQVIDRIGGAFSMAVDASDFNAFIELLDTQGRTRVLSSPRVSTLHNQKAIIKAGSDEFFVTGVKSDTTTGTSTTTSLNVELTPFFSGVALDVTPQISDDGTVLLHIHPTVSEVTDQSKRVDFGGGSSDLPLAYSQIRESDSVVRARSGQLIVIGGLMRETRKRADYRTPLLGDVPGIGRLFRSERDQSRTVELVLLLRPLVPTDADWESLTREPADRAAALASKGGVEGLR
jgi:MSHA biogenesis protein MshL